MATNIVQQAKQIHVILNGVSLFGEVDEINVPDLELLTEEVRPNTDGTIDVEMGLAKLDVELKARGIQTELAKAFGSDAGNPTTRLEVRAALESYQADAIPATWNFVGLAKIHATDPLQGRSELPMTTLTINANFYEHHIDGEEMWYIDVLNDIRRVDGVDRLEAIRNAIEI